MSDIAQIKTLDGCPVTFVRFDGPDKYVVHIDGEDRTIARDLWRRLPSLRRRGDTETAAMVPTK